MKKLLKNTSITLIAVFALLGAGGTVLASANYFTWSGSSSYQNILVTLEQIGTKYAESKTKLDNVSRENEQLTNVVKDKDDAIASKMQENDALKKENDSLKQSSTNDKDSLKQAETDVKDVEKKAKDLLNGMK